MAIVTKDLLLEERYPQLSFLLRFFPIKSFYWTEEKRNAVKGDFFLHRPNALQEELKEVFSSFSCCSFETIYIYGIGLGYYYFPLKEWLSKNQERDLVFLEEDLGALSHFLEMEHAEEVLDHPQVHIRFLLDPRKTSSFLRECAKEFPSEKVEVIALESYARHFKKRFQKLRLGLLRASTIEHALFMESLHAHLFFRNLLPNFHLLPQAFLGNAFKGSFQGVPAIICGAGPSLGGAIEELRTLENKALILAGGSSITALSAKGILPHFSLAIDPNEEEYRRLKMASAFEVPLLYGHRVHPLVFSTANSPLGYLHTLSGGAVEIWLEKELGLQPSPLQAGFTIEAMSVTTLAIEFAATLGCNPIILVGVDLAFAGEKMYADGVFPSPSDSSTVSETRIRKKNREGKWVSTLVKWVMESSAISHFAKKNPHIRFFSATKGGLGFKKISYLPLEKISFPRFYDLRGKVHQAIKNNPLSISSTEVEKALLKLKQSTQKALLLVEGALEELLQNKEKENDPETGKMIFYQMELEEQNSYQVFLTVPNGALQLSFQRKYRPKQWKASPEEVRGVKWEYLYGKWSSFQNLLQFYLKQLEADAIKYE